MPTQSYVVRTLRKAPDSPRPDGISDYRDPASNVDLVAGAVHEIEAHELRLSAEDVGERLAKRDLRSTDLVMIHGSWTTLAESPPFSELAQPYARRERLARGVLDTAILCGFLGLPLLIMFLRVYLRSLV